MFRGNRGRMGFGFGAGGPKHQSTIVTGMPQVIREPVYREKLDPARLCVFRDEKGWLRLTIEGDRSFLDLRVTRAFPMTSPESHIGLLDGRDHSIGMLKTLDGIDAESRKLLEEALEKRYFIPTITRIDRAKEEYGVVYFDVITDHGPRHFVAKGVRDGMDIRDEGQILIADTDGNRYRIPDLQALDVRSRRRIEAFL